MQQTLDISEPTTIDRARSQLREALTEAEFARLAPTLRLIERDRKIKNEFQRLKKQGITGNDAIYALSETYHLSPDRIDELIYPRSRAIRAVGS